jgi:uncharacterized membrane protein YqjE
MEARSKHALSHQLIPSLDARSAGRLVAERRQLLSRRCASPKVGYQLELAEVGDHPSAEMIETKRKSEAVLTWILRGVGTLVMYVGFAVFLAPLSTLASVIPIFGRIVGGAAALVALVIAVPLSILVMAFAWLAYRPLIGGALILLAAAVGSALWRWRKSRAPALPPATPAKAG